MAIDHRVGSKVEKSYRQEDSNAIRVDPHPYIGIVKNNVDPARMGRVQVWIPDLGGDENDPQNWTTIGCATPFMGATNLRKTNKQNSFEQASHSYGMWFGAPDIGTEVIVLFMAGHTDRGYYVACVNNSISRSMMPAIGSSSLIDTTNLSPDIKKSLVPGYQYPVTEFNVNADNLNLTNFTQIPRPIHEEQFRVLRSQGLDRDSTRGTVTSGSQRETPSNVFGISTPGRPFKNDPADDPAFAQKVRSGDLTQDDYAITSRKGGHSFVMDDGSVRGVDQLVRLRSARGHQILMHDSDNILYIANADGSVWIEFNESGRVDIFSTSGVNLRTKGSLNLHADQNINIQAGGKFSVRAEGKIQFDTPSQFGVLSGSGINLQTDSKMEIKTGDKFAVDAGGKISLKAGPKIILDAGFIYDNTVPGDVVRPIKPIRVNSLPDTLEDAGTGLWTVNPGKISTIVSIAPGHEPFYLRELRPPPPEAAGAKIKPQSAYTGSADSTKRTAGTASDNKVTEDDIRSQPEASTTVGNLTKDQTTALMAQLGRSESGGEADPYSAKNDLGYVGKYQMGYQALIDLGYVKSSVSSNSQLTNPNSWTGKDGMDNLDNFYAAKDVQEKIGLEYMNRNYNQLVKDGVITQNDPPETVGGLLQVSWFGAGNAKQWREGKLPDVDKNGNPYAEYFQRGKYAISQMAPKVAAINAG